jgi:hypothetical protein
VVNSVYSFFVVQGVAADLAAAVLLLLLLLLLRSVMLMIHLKHY